MEFGSFRFARSRSLLVFSLVLLCGSEFKAWTQQATASSPAESAAPTLPAAQPISQAAAGSLPGNSDSAKAPQSGVAAGSVANANDNSSLRLGAGDLLEVGVYNVPELSTKA